MFSSPNGADGQVRSRSVLVRFKAARGPRASKEFTFTLDKTVPTLLAITPAAASAPAVQAPSEPGAARSWRYRSRSRASRRNEPRYPGPVAGPGQQGAADADSHPGGSGGKTVWELPLAVNLPEGRYTAEVVDIPTGSQSAKSLRFAEPFSSCHGFH